MKYIFSFLICTFVLSSFAQRLTYKEWQEAAKTEINLRPEYGNVIKDKGYLEEDRIFIENELKQSGTHRKASEELVKLGFTYLYKDDIKTAMRRFNQAWLLDPKNENAYWGFAVIYFNFNDNKKALIQLIKGF